MSLRTIKQVIKSIRTLEGAGFPVRRPFPTRNTSYVDPFLLLDEFGPIDYKPGEAVGAPDHPHRGFETVSYMISGEFHHRDSTGTHEGNLLPGDVQWMTAGSGVVHSEMPSENIQKNGGRLHGFQIWVNLPKSHKMIPPKYQDVPSSKIPERTLADGKATVRIIAADKRVFGEEVPTAVTTHIPINYLHLKLEPGAQVDLPMPSDHNVMVYVFVGDGVKFPTSATELKETKEGDLTFFGQGNDILRIVGPSDKKTEMLILSGIPINEPVARYGPFVMNTQQEIYQAFEDYQSGKMGKIDWNETQ